MIDLAVSHDSPFRLRITTATTAPSTNAPRPRSSGSGTEDDPGCTGADDVCFTGGATLFVGTGVAVDGVLFVVTGGKESGTVFGDFTAA